MDGIKRVTVSKRDRVIHVETPLGLVNIFVNLVDTKGRRVERIEIRGNDYSGEPLVAIHGSGVVSLVEQSST